jgi:hypothetical protein
VAHVVRALFDHSDLRRDFLVQLDAEAQCAEIGYGLCAFLTKLHMAIGEQIRI